MPEKPWLEDLTLTELVRAVADRNVPRFVELLGDKDRAEVLCHAWELGNMVCEIFRLCVVLNHDDAAGREGGTLGEWLDHVDRSLSATLAESGMPELEKWLSEH